MKKLLYTLLCTLLPLALQAQNLEWRAHIPYKKADMKEQLATRLENYVMQPTHTTAAQTKFAKQLAKELRSLGVQNVKVSKSGVVLAEIPANVKSNVPTVAFIAQTQTQAVNVKPQIHKNYAGGDIMLRAEPRVTLDKYNAPQLTRAYGHDLLTSSGNSALGAEGKTGVAVLMQAVEFLDKNPSVSHGTIHLAFVPNGEKLTPSEVNAFKADYILALGSEDLGEIANQTFTTKQFTISFEGNRDVALGTAAQSAFADNILMASDFHTLLPRHLRPETTSGNRGFIYVDTISHSGNNTQITGLVRAFSDEDLQNLASEVTRAYTTTQALYPNAKNFQLTWNEQTQNIKDKISPRTLPFVQNAMRAEDITPKPVAVRTENLSAQLAQANVFAPALFTGHYNPHSELEYVDLDVMESAFRTVMRLLTDTLLPSARN